MKQEKECLEKKKIYNHSKNGFEEVYYEYSKRFLYQFQLSEMLKGERIIKKDHSIKKQKVYILKCYGCSSLITKRLSEEFKRINHLKEERICQFLGVIDYYYSMNDFTFYLFFEQFPNSKLLSKQTFNQFQTLFIIKKIVRGIKYLQENQIFFEHFSPQNILVNDKLEIKIWDLGIIHGFAKLFQKFTNQLPLYASPQFFYSSQYHKRSQSWTIGVILYELLFKQKPFSTKPTKSRRNKFLKEIKIFGERIQKFGITEIEKKNTINRYWVRIFKNTLTTKDRRWSCNEIEKELNEINQIDILKELQPEYNEEQNYIQQKYSDLRFFIKRGQLCYLYNFFLKSNSTHLTTTQLFQQKLKVLYVQMAYKKVRSEKITEFTQYFRKKGQLSEEEEEGQFMKKLNYLKDLYLRLKEKEEQQENWSADVILDDDIDTEKRSYQVLQQIQDYQKYEIKMKTLISQEKMKEELITKSTKRSAQELKHILDLSNVEDQNSLKVFLENYSNWGQIDDKFLRQGLNIIKKTGNYMKKIDERKAQICLNTILDLIKDSKVSNNSKNNYERLKLNLHVLTYTENDKTMKYLEQNNMKIFKKPILIQKQKKERIILPKNNEEQTKPGREQVLKIKQIQTLT